MALHMLSIVPGTTPATASGLLTYYLEIGELQWGAIRACKPDCLKSSFTGHGGGSHLPTGVDLRWRMIRKAEQN